MSKRASNDERHNNRALAKTAIPYNTENLCKGPIHLTNDQIISMMNICFHQQFSVDGRAGHGQVILFVRHIDSTIAGVDFWFQVKIDKEVRNYTGSLIGGSVDFTVYKGLYKPKPKVSENWESDFGIPVKALYEYLQAMEFFKELAAEPLPNPIFENAGWQEIYFKNYQTDKVITKAKYQKK